MAIEKLTKMGATKVDEVVEIAGVKMFRERVDRYSTVADIQTELAAATASRTAADKRITALNALLTQMK